MTREEKAVIIEELSDKFKAIPYFYIVDAWHDSRRNKQPTP